DLQRIMAETSEGVKGRKGEGVSLTPSSPPFTAALLKGRGNYLCLRRYKALRGDGRLQDEEVRTLLKVQLWLPTTETGDKAGLLQFFDDLFQSGGANITGGLAAELPKHFRESAASQGDLDKANAIAGAIGPAVVRGRASVYDCFNRLTAFVTQEAEVSSYDPR